MITEEQLELILQDIEDEIDVTPEVNAIWHAACIMRGTITPENYKSAVLPLFMIRRFECTLDKTRAIVANAYDTNPDIAPLALRAMTNHSYYNTSKLTLQGLLTDQQNLADNLMFYIKSFSENVRDILKVFDFEPTVEKLQAAGKLYPLIKAFSEFDFSAENMPPIKAGYVLEHLLRKFNTSIMTGEHYTAREIIELMVALGLSEGMDDVLNTPKKVISVLDLACGTGGMLSTAHSAIKRVNPEAEFAFFGQELNPESWAICSMEMMLLGLDSADIRNGNSLMGDPFANKPQRLVLENPPFGVAWAGDEAPIGSEEAVLAEVAKKERGRFPGGKPAGSDSQMLFLQAALANLDANGRAVVVENSSPLVTGGTSSGESQIRRYLLENDKIEAVIKLPAALFYNTSLNVFLWILSNDKDKRRRGKIQLINAENIFHKMRKGMGDKRNELTYEDKLAIAKEYIAFQDSEITQIHDVHEFIYQEWTVRQPMQRNYCLSAERIEAMFADGVFNSLYDAAKVAELEEAEKLSGADQKKLDKFHGNKAKFDVLKASLEGAASDAVYYEPDECLEAVNAALSELPDGIKFSKAEKMKVVKAVSEMDKSAPVQKDKKTGEVLYDDETKDTEVVKGNEDVEAYMAREVVPYVPDAHWEFEEDLTKKTPVIKTGAEIPFERCFYVYETPEPSEVIAARIRELDERANALMGELFGEV